jgi:hypothetical protein
MSADLFLVFETRGPRWNSAKPLEAQEHWEAHRRFMNALEAEGFVVLGGPILATPDVLLVTRAPNEAEIRSRLAKDVWQKEGLLRITNIRNWDLRLGMLSLSKEQSS